MASGAHRDGEEGWGKPTGVIGVNAVASSTAPAQSWRPADYRENCSFVAAGGQPVVELLNPKAGERILDLGCGDGTLTKVLVAAGCEVVGVDSSPAMVATARAESLDAHVVDGAALQFDAEFDAVFSNAALHWMSEDPDAVIAGVGRALKPGGRFVAEMGGLGNVAAISTALAACTSAESFRRPWFFPSPESYRSMLEAHGFQVDFIQLIPRPTPLPAGMRNWFTNFGDSFFVGLDSAERDRVEAAAEALLKPALFDPFAGKWYADYVRLRFAARLIE